MSHDFDDRIKKGLDQYSQEHGDLSTVLQNMESKIDIRSGNRRGMYALIAGLLIVISLVFYFGIQRPQDSTFYAQNYFEYPPSLDKVSRGEHKELNAGQRAGYYYRQGNFDKALELWNTYSEKDLSDTIKLYHGGIFIGKESYKEAINILSQISNSYLVDMKGWYLALAYLGNGENEKAKKALQSIVHNKGHYKQEEAQELLQNLK